jgi:hypothetical protein
MMQSGRQSVWYGSVSVDHTHLRWVLRVGHELWCVCVRPSIPHSASCASHFTVLTSSLSSLISSSFSPVRVVPVHLNPHTVHVPPLRRHRIVSVLLSFFRS